MSNQIPQTEQERNDAIKALIEAMPKMSDRDQAFAGSMIGQFGKKRNLSPKQWPWVFKLADRVNNPQPAAEPVELGDFKGVFDLLATAKDKIKAPKIHLQTANGDPVLVKMAGPKSRNAGMMYVTDGGGFYDNTYYGKIAENGAIEIGRKNADAPELPAILDALRELQANPAEVVTRHGKLTGHCCFCGLHLGGKDGEALSKTGQRSKAAGFGETCAKRYGLHAEWKAAADAGQLEDQVAAAMGDDVSEYDGEREWMGEKVA